VEVGIQKVQRFFRMGILHNRGVIGRRIWCLASSGSEWICFATSFGPYWVPEGGVERRMRCAKSCLWVAHFLRSGSEER